MHVPSPAWINEPSLFSLLDTGEGPIGDIFGLTKERGSFSDLFGLFCWCDGLMGDKPGLALSAGDLWSSSCECRVEVFTNTGLSRKLPSCGQNIPDDLPVSTSDNKQKTWNNNHIN